jgi:hypothetical protein
MFKKFRYSDSAPTIAERSVVSPSMAAGAGQIY